MLKVQIFSSNSKSVELSRDSKCGKFKDYRCYLFGSIFNLSEIENILGFDDHELDTHDLIIWGFKNRGTSFFNQLNGEFSLVLVDYNKGDIYLVRDHLGMLPFAFFLENDLLFVSDNPIFLSRKCETNKQSISNFLLNNFLWQAFDFSLLPNLRISQVSPGHFVKIDIESNVTFEKYWFPEKIKLDRYLSRERVIKELNRLLLDAVEIRCNPNIKSAAHVSGGLDSSSVAILARRVLYQQNIFIGFSWSPEITNESKSLEYDERELVNVICRENEIKPVFIQYGVDDNIKMIDNWETPSEMIFEKKVLEFAKDNGVKVIFSGWGGDEFISINNRGVDADLIRQFYWKSFFKKYSVKKPRKLISALVYNSIFTSLKRGFTKYKIDPSIYPYLKKAVKSNIIPRNLRFSYTSRKKVHLQLLHMGHLSKRANDWYLAGQRHGITYRYPLLDKRIVEFMLKVPSKHFVGGNNNRIIFREVVKDLLPKEVLDNISKDDPVKSKHLENLFADSLDFLVENLELYKQCKYFNFIDFNQIESDLEKYKKTKEKELEYKISSILSLIRTSYAFVNDYLNE